MSVPSTNPSPSPSNQPPPSGLQPSPGDGGCGVFLAVIGLFIAGFVVYALYSDSQLAKENAVADALTGAERIDYENQMTLKRLQNKWFITEDDKRRITEITKEMEFQKWLKKNSPGYRRY